MLIITSWFLLTFASRHSSASTIVAVLSEEVQSLREHIQDGIDFERATLPDDLNVTLQVIIARDGDTHAVLQRVCGELKSGMSVLLDMTSAPTNNALRALSSYLAIPHLTLADVSSPSRESCDDSLTLFLQSTASLILPVINDVVIFENLTRIALLYDESFGVSSYRHKILRNVPADHIQMRLPLSPANMSDQIDTLVRMDIANVFLVAEAWHSDAFIGEVSRKTLARLPTIFVVTKEARLQCLKCYNATTVIQIAGATQYKALLQYSSFLEKKRTKHSGFNRDMLHMDNIFAFDLARAVTMALSVSLNASIRDLSRGSCQNKLPSNHTGDKRTEKESFVNYLKHDTVIHGVYGTLQGDGHTLSRDPLLTIRTQIFSKTGVRSSQSEPPFVYKNDKGEYIGFCIDLLNQIASAMNFKYSIYDSPDGLYGNINEKGVWNGVIKELIDKNADIAIGPLSVMAERENVIDFTVPFYGLVGISILMKKPESKDSLFNFVHVLSSDVWWCTIAAFFGVSIILYLFDRFSPFSYQNNRGAWNGNRKEPRVFTIKEGIWFCMMSLTPQGGGEAPRSLSGRMIAATWWLFGFIMIAIYTANLAAFLTVSRLETSIESMDDLSKQFNTKYAPMEGSSSKVYFQRMAAIEKKFYSIWKDMSLNDSLTAAERAQLAVWDYPVSNKYSGMWDTMVRSRFPVNLDDAVSRVLSDESFAFIGDSTQVRYATLHDCRLMQVGEDFSRKPFAVAVQQGSPLKYEISAEILRLLRHRYLEELDDMWWYINKKNCSNQHDEADGISFQSIGGVFLLVAVGIALATFALVAELYVYKFRPILRARRHQQRSDCNGHATSGNNHDTISSNNHAYEVDLSSDRGTPALDQGFSTFS